MAGAPDYAAEGPVIGGSATLFSPDYAPEEIYEIAAQLMKAGGLSPNQPEEGDHARSQKPRTGTSGTHEKASKKG